MTTTKCGRLLALGTTCFLLAACAQGTEGVETTTRSLESGPGTLVDVIDDAGTFSTLLAAAEETGVIVLLEGGGPFTLFAPNDEAFSTLGQSTLDMLMEDPEFLQEFLLFHMVEGAHTSAGLAPKTTLTTLHGSPVTVVVEGHAMSINGASVITGDVTASNGVIHEIDKVLVPPTKLGTTLEVLAEAGVFNTFVSAAIDSGVYAVLDGDEAHTVFAPTDGAFAALGEATLGYLMADDEALEALVKHHVIEGAFTLKGAPPQSSAISLQGGKITVMLNGEATVNGVTITVQDIPTSNGVVHMISGVLIPPAAMPNLGQVLASTGVHDWFMEAVDAAGLDAILDSESSYTLFAPHDAAFDAMALRDLRALFANRRALRTLVQAHVVPGKISCSEAVAHSPLPTLGDSELDVHIEDGILMAGAAAVITKDVPAYNGIVQIVDGFVFVEEEPTSLDVLDDYGIFTTLLVALEQTGLSSMVDGEAAMTLFAPSNEAFKAMGSDALHELFADTEALTDVVLNHIVAGGLRSSMALEAGSATTLFGAEVTFDTNDAGQLTVDGATAFRQDVMTSTGVVHIIDQVLMPPPH